ncbi:uncharacterized protein F4807DRAFT_472993 [Annulohypoxylon truncatum]|uniref:uncharacterized protein n=1 Tax=Annulohypoxylon truncatum TaxID=327061 RepID=UPI0020087762|nr:uncharacterized protein F4807DRAFT_472993 [Annulohypoxylon truncatum]KAI1211539.1 hypothetical protein F4807DRAFT_472993 [Annulohypoxylon truncatum]
MASITNTVNEGKWGKETEKQLGVEDLESWRNEMYVNTIPWEYDRFRELLERYSKIPPNEVEAEIFKIRNEAWGLVKYPCIGHFTYVKLPEFGGDDIEMQKAIERLRAPDSQDAFLELGGFIFQTIRRLVFEGVDSTRLYGTDLHAEFIELGYKQFRDRETLKATLVAGDLLLPNEEYAGSELACTFDGKISVAHASNFFHLFSWESQLVICERIIHFFRRDLSAKHPAVLFGSHMGSCKPGKTEFFGTFLHDEMTFQLLWDTVGERTATRWKVEMQIVGAATSKPNAYGKDARMVRYVVSQVAS